MTLKILGLAGLAAVIAYYTIWLLILSRMDEVEDE